MKDQDAAWGQNTVWIVTKSLVYVQSDSYFFKLYLVLGLFIKGPPTPGWIFRLALEVQEYMCWILKMEPFWN